MLFQKFSFGVYCVKWDCDLMKDIEVVESGNRQGCLIFHLAFVLTVGPLAIEIKNCKGIKAIRNWSAVNDVNMEAVFKIALYADDITLFLPKEEEISNALSIVEVFSRTSGLEIKKMKPEVMWLDTKNEGEIYWSLFL